MDALSGDINQVINADTLTNEMLKNIIEKIEADNEENAEAFLRKLADQNNDGPPVFSVKLR